LGVFSCRSESLFKGDGLKSVPYAERTAPAVRKGRPGRPAVAQDTVFTLRQRGTRTKLRGEGACLARRDVERLRQIVGLQRRMRDLSASERAQRALAHRHIFREALTWLEIHGGVPDVVEHWKALVAESGESVDAAEGGAEGQPPAFRPKRRRRRRRRRFSPTPGQS
jgi:hypothetical protein